MNSKKKISNKQPLISVASRLRNSHKNLLRVVGIGASAGGLEALEVLFKNAPLLSGMAFVVVQHLDIKHKSIMSELLQHATLMQVTQITDQTKIEPNCIYIIPPNYNLTIKKGILYLSPLTSTGHSLNKTIDFFFHSLANDQRERAVGIILSGLGDDGVVGLASIKEKNGLTLAQDPSEAKFNDMPSNAIDAKVVDIVAPTTKLLKKITDVVLDPVIHKISTDKKTKYSEQNLAAITHIIKLIHKKTGYDFLQYKIGTIYRRIERRIMIHKIDTILGYLDYIQENPHELEILMKELLIGVTSFFRDPETWKSLESEILPELLAGFKEDKTLRIWVPGCSTGEEVYTLAIVLQEAINKLKTSNHYMIQIFATDISIEAIEIGSKGVYADNIINDIPQEYLMQYFKKLDPPGNGYQVNENIRKMVIFAHPQPYFECTIH